MKAELGNDAMNKEGSAPPPRGEALPPVGQTDEVERGVAGVWREVLGRSPVGPHDNFFALGGRSLTAVRTASRLGTMFQISLSVRQIFDKPTVAELAREIQKLRNRRKTKPLSRIRPAGQPPFRPEEGRLAEIAEQI